MGEPQKPITGIWLVKVFALGLLCWAGCSERDARFADFQPAKGDLGSFILEQAPRFGVRLLATNDLPPLPAQWEQRLSGQELTVVADGDFFEDFHAFLSKAVGNLPGQSVPPKLVAGVVQQLFYGTNSGATVSCTREITADGKVFTGLAIIGYAVSSAESANYARTLKEASKFADNRDEALDAARIPAPYLTNFVRLFPEAQVLYRNFGGGFGYSVSVDLHGRYEVWMQLPVIFDSSSRDNVIGYGEPSFGISEFERVLLNKSGQLETWFKKESQRGFGSVEWQKIVEANGDFGSIGYRMITNQPIPGAELRRTPRE
jgi:hypothetical protein